ncbi:MAG TPA: BamA/TamA family outer membrane protein, partial [Saprospiraceae bacterium]|nr:BamA/TamA family outer membrane protein [Saprospiraceae bacterium]
MKALLIFQITLIFFCTQFNAQEVSHNIFLVGNTAEANSLDNLNSLRAVIMQETGKVILIYNGDILHQNGLNEKPTSGDSAFIKSLIDVVKDILHAKVYFVPGDEDWNTSDENGWKSVKKLENLVNGIAGKKIFLPEDGCPGPEVIEVGKNMEIVFINSSWWIYPQKRPHAPGTKCDVLVEPQVIEQLAGAIEEAEEKNVLVVGHHPAISNGNFGGQVSALQHMKPPVIGTFIAGYHQNIGSPRDIAHPSYTEFANHMKYLMEDYAPFIYASAHDFNLQALEFENSHQIVSGSIIKKSKSTKSKNTVYRSNSFGFIKLSYYDDGKVTMNGYELNDEIIDEVTSLVLYQSSCNPDDSGAPFNTRYVPCKESITPAQSMDSSFVDSMGIAVAAPEYEAGFTKKIFLGSLYRSSWATTIQVPYLNLDTVRGGLTAKGKGGGKQTQSLSLEGGDGKSYVFRSIHKDPIKALDPILRKTFIVGLSRQLIATQHPYGAMPVAFLLNHTSILHAQPKLFILPNDPKLGMYQKDYGGLLGILEEKPKKGKSDKPGTYGADEVVRSFDLFRELYKDHDNRVDPVAFARARVFDIWIGDWDRNEDNWKWAGYKNENTTTYYPIPRDRDHVFSQWNGLIPFLADRKWAVQSFEHFDFHYGDLKTGTWNSRHLDRFLLSSLDRDQWQLLTDELQQTMNDNVIDSAIQQFPKAIIPLSGNTIGAKLKIRRNELPIGIEKFYSLLSKNVDVVGSNKGEHFKIISFENGNVEVTMHDLNKSKDGPSGEPLYHRIFIPDDTKSVNIYGLDDEDLIMLEGKPPKSIVLRVFGGKGDDKIINSAGGRKIRIYDYNKQQIDLIASPASSKVTLSDNRDLVEYNRQSFKYNTYLPLPVLYFSPDNGLTAGLGYTWTFHRFGEPDYSDILHLSGKVGTEETFQLKFENEFHHVFGKWDWLVGGEISKQFPVVYFYGTGNETQKLPGETRNFYKSRFDSYNAYTGLQRVFWRKSSFNVNLIYKNYSPHTLSEDVLINPSLPLGKSDLSFLGSEAAINIDFRDNSFAPHHGVRFLAKQSYNLLLEPAHKNFTNSEISLEFYQTTSKVIPITFGIKGGASHITGDIPFYEYNTLGRTSGLRGFERDRFAGNTT